MAAAVGPCLVELLERRSLMAAAPVITEFVASNSSGLVDGNGAHSDWIEIQNHGDASINLAGWHLTDNAASPAKWTFPSYTLNAGAYMVVIADSSVSTVPDSLGYLHTNFSLSADGENLSLRQPDGTAVSQFGPNGALYPKQGSDISYGTSKVLTTTNLVVTGAPAKAFIPVNNSFDANQWTVPGYVDAGWISGTTGVGYDGGGTASTAGLLARWYAPSLNLADNANVSSWGALTGIGTATAGGNVRPTYQSDAASLINGHAVVRFDGINDQLKITNQSLSGVTNFTVAMVFRTSTPGKAGEAWYNNTGIVDAEVGGETNDWGLAIDDAGAVGAGIGNPDATIYSDEGFANGTAHVAVYTKSGTTTAISIDGGAPIYGSASATARNVGQLVFGSLNTNINYFNGDLGEVRLYNAAMSDDNARSLSGEMAGTWGISPAAGVYTPKIGLDLQAMAGVSSTANIRVPFTVTNPQQFDTLLLNMKYDDGFVAYINGTEVARRNAPGGAITYTSTATTARTDAAAQTAETIDISAFTNLLQGNGATNILAIRALNASAADSDLLMIPELIAATSVTGTTFMTTPTPGAANSPGYAGLVSPVTASVPHGYYTAPIATTLTTATTGATIVYTLDGSTPTLDNGIKVLPPGSGATSVVLNISSTTVLRSAAFRSGYLASSVSAASYFFVTDIVKQPEYTPAGAYWDVGMDKNVVNATQKWSVAQALTAIPTISLTIDSTALFDPVNGIYTNPLQKGDAWERPVSVEYFDPNNTANQFFINAGIRIVGAVSRNTSRPKKGFKLYFRSEYGESKLDYPVFGTNDLQTVFDHLTLRSGHNYTWANLGDLPYKEADYLRDQFARDTQLALTGKSSHGDYAQLYINGQYWGLYNTAEDVDADWAAANYGGTADDYDVIKPDDGGGIAPDDGDLTAWNQLFASADAASADGTVSAAEYAGITSQVDVKNLVDYMLSVFYRGDQDAPVLVGSTTSPRNFIAVHNRTDPSGKFEFQTWDGEFAMNNIQYDRTEVYGNQNPGRLFQQLKTNAEFRQLVVDEVGRAFGYNGPLSIPANQARYAALMAKIDKAIVGESARWGNAKQADPGMRDTYWVAETDWILNQFIPQRMGVVTDQLKGDFPELNTVAPIARINGVANWGGVLASGTSIALVDGNALAGKMYYTLDGTDPRAVGGAISATAIAYAGSFTLPGARTINARTRKNGIWSALQSLVFTVSPPSLRLAEMNYHPAVPSGGTFAKDEYEFIKVVNTGATPIDLSGMQLFTGATFTVANGVTLAAGARGVFVKNQAAFQQAYGTGVQILGVYTDYLSNGGEQVRLFDPNSGTNIFDVTYVDSWYPTTDGGGYTLVVRDLGPSQAASTVLGVASAWRASTTVGGTPAADKPAAAVSKVSSFTLDDGTAQRSRVRSATIVIDGAIPLANIGAGAFTLTQTSGTISSWTATVSSVTTPSAGKTAISLVFSGPAAVGGSIADGRYTLNVDGSKIVDAAGQAVDALGTGVSGSTRTFAISRLYGDIDGDQSVTVTDFNVMAGTFGKSSGNPLFVNALDFNGDGSISVLDFNAFSARFGIDV